MATLALVPSDWKNPSPIWKSADGAYRLAELVHESHLYRGNIFMRDGLVLRYIDPSKELDDENLYNWAAVQSGIARVFSLMDDEYHTVLATIVVDVSGEQPVFRRIWDFRGQPIPDDAEFYEPLQLALEAIKRKLGGGKLVVPLHYKWPLLADGQDVLASEARLAFHLHRLNLTGEPLRKAVNGKTRISTALTQARMTISASAVSDLAVLLDISADELLRDLTEDELREWAFYRISAQNRTEVWRKACGLWRKHGLSLRQAAKLIGAHLGLVSRSITGKRATVLTYQQALVLLDALPEKVEPELRLPGALPRR